ncbi:hypothetical protein V5O48_018931, partial [Marasmius crinis-equi]
MSGSDFFKGAAQTGISGAPNFTNTGRDSTQHITNLYLNSTVNQYYSSPPPSDPLSAQPRSPVNEDVNGSHQRQTTTTTRSSPNGQAPREEERVERPDEALAQVGNPLAADNEL